MRFGIVILPQFPWPEAARRWRAAEEYGFDVAWTYDHLSWRSLADEPWHATVPTLTAAALSTSSIGLGTFVANPNFRHPVPFAKELATIDQISGGRVVAGLGSGGTGFDAHVLGQEALSPRQRHERFVEFADALDRLLRFEAPGSGGVSFSGEWFTADRARMVGTPAQSPRMPIQLAANGPRGIALAAGLADGWITTGREDLEPEAWWRHVGELSARFGEACATLGRDVDGAARVLSIDAGERYSLASVDAFEDAVGRAAELGFTEVVAHWPRESGVYAGEERVLDEVAARLPALR
ncbi:LLM class flavin-dependent oxidoreductase [Agromyces mediolanus]|uniref:LLM class flavin-dependent oxidoreductase n=1 Tax=Agromyces mediolanus TaxID=41986 RepID=UPI0038389C13